jgi:hypothetical protein
VSGRTGAEEEFGGSCVVEGGGVPGCCCCCVVPAGGAVVGCDEGGGDCVGVCANVIKGETQNNAAQNITTFINHKVTEAQRGLRNKCVPAFFIIVSLCLCGKTCLVILIA